MSRIPFGTCWSTFGSHSGTSSTSSRIQITKSSSGPRITRATRDDWENTLARFTSDLREMIAIVKNPRTDLHARIPHGDGQTILREAILIVDHNAYHIGEFAILRQVAKNWK